MHVNHLLQPPRVCVAAPLEGLNHQGTRILISETEWYLFPTRVREETKKAGLYHRRIMLSYTMHKCQFEECDMRAGNSLIIMFKIQQKLACELPTSTYNDGDLRVTISTMAIWAVSQDPYTAIIWLFFFLKSQDSYRGMFIPHRTYVEQDQKGSFSHVECRHDMSLIVLFLLLWMMFFFVTTIMSVLNPCELGEMDNPLFISIPMRRRRRRMRYAGHKTM